MALARKAQWRLFILGAITLATVSFHYGLFGSSHSEHGGFMHAIHGRLCYIPIILSAIWFGIKGGVGSALLITLFILPYPKIRGIEDSVMLVNEYTEMIFYVGIGLMAGIFTEQQWRERRKREELLEELVVKERLSSLGQMAAGLAHEIKNPLGSIQGATEILSDDVSDDPRKREIFEVLSKETKRLDRVVNHFLSFARPRPLQLSSGQINDVITAAVSQVELESGASGIAIVPELSGGMPVIDFDAEQIHQVLLNVILNAVAASPDAGRVRVRSAHRPDAVEIAVSDDGAGIEEGNLQRIFDPFFTTKDSGTGLGLSISHTIVHDHDGHIEVQSSTGPTSGTTVTIRLPRTRRAE
jgi:signal transduction histidine kinase